MYLNTVNDLKMDVDAKEYLKILVALFVRFFWCFPDYKAKQVSQ